MRVTTISTAALCSLGVLTACGVSNQVTNNPQPEPPQDQPTTNSAANSVTAKPVQIPVQQTIAPPEVMPAQPLIASRDLAKERQQREAKLAQDLRKVAVPAPQSRGQNGRLTEINLTEINLPDINRLSIDRIVARSVNSTPAMPARTAPVTAPANPAPANPAPALTIAAQPPQSSPPASPIPSANLAVNNSVSGNTELTPSGASSATASNTSANTSPQNQPSIAAAPIARSTTSVATNANQNAASTTPAREPDPPGILGQSSPQLPHAAPATAQSAVLIPPAQGRSSAPVDPTDSADSTATTAAPTAIAQPSPAAETAPVAIQPPVSPQIARQPSARPQPPTPSPTQTISRSLSAVTARETATQVVAQLPQQDQAILDAPIVNATRTAAAPVSAATSTAASTTASTTASTAASTAVKTQASPPAARPSVQTATSGGSGTAGAAPAIATTAGITVTSVNETYRLGPGDRISLRFFNTPEYNGEAQVQSDGTLNLPLVGSFTVAGMTVRQAEAEIAARYQSELRYAIVTVSLMQARPLQVAIVGEVQQPGSYTLSLLEGAQFPSLVQAIQTAGGTTQAADLRQIQVQRASSPTATQTITVNLVDLLQSGNLSQDLKLRDGDRIIVPTATTVDFAEATQFAASNFAAAPSQPFDVAIVGEVFRPGAYKMGGSGGRATVTQAIQLAGGVKPDANIRQIQIRRITRSGTEQVINVDFGQLLQTGNLYQDLALQQGDRITIPTASILTPEETVLLAAANVSPETISVNVVGEVKSPGLVSVAPSSTLNQAILAAGGLNNRATRELELIRLEPNGTLTRRTINMDILQGFNTAENPLLRNNDIIVVGRSGLAQFGDQFNQINSVIGPLLQLIPFRPF